MKPDLIVLGVVVLVLAATALIVVLLQQDEPPHRAVVDALAAPQPEHPPRARNGKP